MVIRALSLPTVFVAALAAFMIMSSAAALVVGARKVNQSSSEKSSDRQKPPRSSSVKSQSSDVAPGDAAQRAQRRYGGRVLSVVLEHGPGGSYYRVKLLDEGRVRVVHIDARH